MLSDRGSILLQAVFTHILRNAVDHGLEDAETRRRKGKDEQGLIHIVTSVEGSHLLISCGDDGGGLDLERIREKGIAQGWMTADQKWSRSEIADLIFHSGLSTKEQVTEISGRGVGMDAVRSYLEKAGASVQIELLDQSETMSSVAFRLIIKLPEPLWWPGAVKPEADTLQQASA
jgi:chemotaxis protein histidine kinase CheA